MNNICNKCGADNLSNAKYCRECGYELPKPIIEDTQQTTTKPVNKKKSMATIIGSVVGAIIAVSVAQQLFFKSPSIDKALMEIANEVNKSCPVMIDSETLLKNAIALPNKTFQYNYMLVNMDKESIDTVEAKGYLEPYIINSVRTIPEMQYFRDNKTIINYCYRDKMGNYVFTISVTPEQYK